MNNKRGYAALERCCIALYDEKSWKKTIERQLKNKDGLSLKTGAVDKWRKSCEKWPDFEINPGIWDQIIALLKQKQIDINNVLNDLDAN